MAQYYMLHKPRGLLTARRDARRETVMSCFPEALRETLHPVGRLDRDTEGLLLFTDDGMLDVRLLRPERHVEKEYEYRAFGCLDEAAMRRLEAGVPLLEGQPLSLPARAQLLAHTSIGESAPYLPERFREKYLKNPSRPVTVGKLWITEGRKHQVKLMVKAVGGHVFYLKRLAIGPVRLDEALRPGEYLIRLRLTRAKELLRATDLPVSEIAYRVGMENTSYFISVFRAREGATPQQYRRRWSPVA